MKLSFIFVLLTTYCYSLSAQYYNQQEHFLKANSVWVFGYRFGLDFNTSPPQPINTAIESIESSASVSDSAGQLLFYLGSHGTVWNRTHTPMLNGTGLYPYSAAYNSSSCVQGAAIVPVIDTPWKYYIFTNTQRETYRIGSIPPTLSYSVIDMTLDNGLGGIEPGRKNIPLYNYGLHEGMIAIPGDNCDIWLMTLSSYYPLTPLDPNIPDPRDTQYFHAWHITRDGIDPNPVISNPHPALSENDNFGTQMSVSPNRQRIAFGLKQYVLDRSKRGTLLCKFDPESGRTSEGIMLPLRANLSRTDDWNTDNYSSCFSPDNTKLYGAGPGVGIVQHDIEVHDSATIIASKYVVKRIADVFSLRLYNDTVYSTGPTRLNYLYRINRPNESGLACELDTFQVYFTAVITGRHKGPRYSLGNEVVFPINKTEGTISYDTLCLTPINGKIARTLSAPEGYDLYEWDDRSTGPTRSVMETGTYWVKYRNRHACMTYVDTFAIHVIDLDFSLGEDKKLLFCDHPDSYLPLKANTPEKDVTYSWQDGSTDNQFQVTQPGTYWVEARKGKCVASDTIHIDGTEGLNLSDTVICNGDPINITLGTPDMPEGTVIQWSTGSADSSIHISDTGLYTVTLINPPCILTDSARITTEYCDCYAQMPNAFSPNGDGLNDFFTPMVDPNCPIQGYMLNIYNRFGERIFHTTNLTKGWDGFHKGQPVDAGVYFYEVHFYGGTRLEKFYFKGDVTVIR